MRAEKRNHDHVDQSKDRPRGVPHRVDAAAGASVERASGGPATSEDVVDLSLDDLAAIEQLVSNVTGADATRSTAVEKTSTRLESLPGADDRSVFADVASFRMESGGENIPVAVTALPGDGVLVDVIDAPDKDPRLTTYMFPAGTNFSLADAKIIADAEEPKERVAVQSESARGIGKDSSRLMQGSVTIHRCVLTIFNPVQSGSRIKNTSLVTSCNAPGPSAIYMQINHMLPLFGLWFAVKSVERTWTISPISVIWSSYYTCSPGSWANWRNETSSHITWPNGATANGFGSTSNWINYG